MPSLNDLFNKVHDENDDTLRVKQTGTPSLPSGAATETTLSDIASAVDDIKGYVDGIETSLTGIATETTLASIKTAVEIIDNFISGSRGLVTEDNSAAIKTALEIMDDWDDNNAARISHGKTLKKISSSCASSGDNTILSAVADKKITVYSVKLTVQGATTQSVLAKFTDGASGTELDRMYFRHPDNAMAGVVDNVTPPAYLFQGSTNTALILNLSGAITVNYSIRYWEE